MNTPRPLIIGHRGSAGEAPENTLGSFALALEQGCDGIELDVHVTKDNQIVVCHDFTLERTTNGKGWIYQMTAGEIRNLDAGSWHSEKYRGEKVPLLEEVFDLVPPGILINIEAKHAYEGRMEALLLEFLRRINRFEHIVISSFDHKCVARIKRAEPEAQIGLLYAANLMSHAKYARSFDAEVHSLHPRHELLGAGDIAEAREHGLRTYPYTVNAEGDFKRLADAGVSGIITDYPARLAGFLAARV